MKHILANTALTLLVCSTLMSQPALEKIGDDTQHQFAIGKIFPNPMSNPNGFFTNFSIPDTATLCVTLISKEIDTVFSHRFQSLTPGKYQFSFVSRNTRQINVGRHKVLFSFYVDSYLTYYAALDCFIFANTD